MAVIEFIDYEEIKKSKEAKTEKKEAEKTA